MGAMTEWKVFASLAVQYLGMPVDAMPFYDSAPKWQNKADKLLSYILSTGNFGHKRDQSLDRATRWLREKQRCSGISQRILQGNLPSSHLTQLRCGSL